MKRHNSKRSGCGNTSQKDNDTTGFHNYNNGDRHQTNNNKYSIDIDKDDDDIDSLRASQLEIPYEMNYDLPKGADDDDDDDSDEAPGIESPDRVKAQNRREPLRPNDIIFYTCPVFIAGTIAGERRAVVLGTNPNHNKFPLILDNSEQLPWDTTIQRIGEYHKGEIYEHHGDDE